MQPPDLDSKQAASRGSGGRVVHRRRWLAAGLACCTAGGVGMWGIAQPWLGSDTKVAKRRTARREPDSTLEALSDERLDELIEPHLQVALESSLQGVDEAIEHVTEYFDKAKKRVPGFTEVALGWGSKGRLVWEHLPFTGDPVHRAFLTKQFKKRVISPKRMTEQLENCVMHVQRAVENAENQMLVNLRVDLEQLPDFEHLTQLDTEQLQDGFQKTMRQTAEAVGNDTMGSAAELIVSGMAGGLATKIVTRLAVSGGIMAAGGAGSGPSLGISVVVAFIIDYIVSWIWDWYADPNGNLTRELTAKLDSIETMLIEGNSDAVGLRRELTSQVRNRSELRTKTLKRFLRQQQL